MHEQSSAPRSLRSLKESQSRRSFFCNLVVVLVWDLNMHDNASHSRHHVRLSSLKESQSVAYSLKIQISWFLHNREKISVEIERFRLDNVSLQDQQHHRHSFCSYNAQDILGSIYASPGKPFS